MTSVGSGNWFTPTLWSPPVVPSTCTVVTINAGHSITVDSANATASTTTLSGTLAFSTVQSSTLTLAGGDLTVAPGGTLAIGTAASPIPAAYKATLILSSGAYAGQYGLIVNNGGNFIVYGSTRTPFTTANATAAIGATSISVDTPITGWSQGDLIAVDTEVVTITSIAGILSGISPGLTLGHVVTSTAPVWVSNLTRNAVVRSSGTNLSGNTAYIQNLTKYATSFSLNYGEFNYLGQTSCTSGKCGISFDGLNGGTGVLGTVSAAVVRGAYIGLHAYTASNLTWQGNIIMGAASHGMFVYSSDHITISSNVVLTSGDYGIQLQNGVNHHGDGNILRLNTTQGLGLIGSGNNRITYNWIGNNPVVDNHTYNTFISNNLYGTSNNAVLLSGQYGTWINNSRVWNDQRRFPVFWQPVLARGEYDLEQR